MSANEVVASGLLMPESPRWRSEELWFVDLNRIRSLSADGQLSDRLTAECPLLLGMAFDEQGRVYTNDAVGRRVLRRELDGSILVVADLSSTGAGMINELVLLADGSIIVGDVGFDVLNGAAPRAFSLLRIGSDGKAERFGPEIMFSNGMAIAPDRCSFIVAEYVGGAILRYSLQGSQLIAQRVADDLGTGVDGVAFDRDGSIWFANMEGGELVHLSHNGEEIERRDTGFPHATSLAITEAGTIYATTLSALPDGQMTQANGSIVKVLR
ncbi:SMP-30/gluconolactonase/LRE family protein [Sphingobium sp.]|uniref:SMP-30/gluconolactonase/LRE family protein n=1 Tax=Sphingobium sp. TaxID=1912891 RepID=UPI0028BE8D99|nr:SMP-30/gluconolactonase/LRE family protein [Sphingobium sp.]